MPLPNHPRSQGTPRANTPRTNFKKQTKRCNPPPQAVSIAERVSCADPPRLALMSAEDRLFADIELLVRRTLGLPPEVIIVDSSRLVEDLGADADLAIEEEILWELPFLLHLEVELDVRAFQNDEGTYARKTVGDLLAFALDAKEKARLGGANANA